MNTKHTPGPWRVGFDDGSGGHFWIVGPDDKAVVSGGVDDWGVTHGVRAPHDARLIAAAPDLLEAAQDALIALEAAPDTVTTRIAKQKLTAAISKASLQMDRPDAQESKERN